MYVNSFSCLTRTTSFHLCPSCFCRQRTRTAACASSPSRGVRRPRLPPAGPRSSASSLSMAASCLVPASWTPDPGLVLRKPEWCRPVMLPIPSMKPADYWSIMARHQCSRLHSWLIQLSVKLGLVLTIHTYTHTCHFPREPGLAQSFWKFKTFLSL